MGYYVKIETNRIEITDPAGALKAINELHTVKAMLGNCTRGSYPASSKINIKSSYTDVAACKCYAWVENPKTEAGFETLEEAFSCWSIDLDDNGDKDNLTYFVEHYEDNKLGDQERFFETIAPFCEDEMCITYVGEDNCLWKQEKINGVLTEASGTITYDFN